MCKMTCMEHGIPLQSIAKKKNSDLKNLNLRLTCGNYRKKNFNV